MKITGNDSYSPLNVQDEFLPDWWVYTRSISEPMLSLPYDYDALSLGLLNYQERSMIVPLQENRAGCLEALNPSCQNKVIGSGLLKNVTITIHKVDVVCVPDIRDYSFFELLYYEDNIEYDCCIREKISGEIRCLIDTALGSRHLMWFLSCCKEYWCYISLHFPLLYLTSFSIFKKN